MVIECPECKTLYEIRDSYLSDSGTSVRCTRCGETFFADKSSTTESETPYHVEWVVRSAGGVVTGFRNQTELQKFIVDGLVLRSDEVSRDGGDWKVLGSFEMLAPFFAQAE